MCIALERRIIEASTPGGGGEEGFRELREPRGKYAFEVEMRSARARQRLPHEVHATFATIMTNSSTRVNSLSPL